jgi:chemotaxis signal transduction protein
VTAHLGSAAQLRRAFDAGFEPPPADRSAPHDDLAAVRVGDLRCAIRLAEIAGLFADRTITPLPSSFPELLGLAGVRDAVFPVFDLGHLLGHPGTTAPRWLVLSAREPTIGLAFDAYEGHLAVPVADEPDGTAEVVRHGDVLRTLVSIPSIHGALQRRVRSDTPGRHDQ